MTLASSVSRNDYIGNGSTDTYPYTFKIFTETDLRVTVQDTAGVETELAYPADYAVTGVRSAGGGNVVLSAGNLTSGYGLTLRRVRTATQETDLRNQGEFYPEVYEDALDHQVMLIQQQEDEIDRTIKLPETETGTPGGTTLPTATQRAGKLLGFDGSGNPTALTTIPTSSVTISAFGESLIDDATAADARATLGFVGTGATVGTANLADDAVSEDKILAGAVTETKIADDAVTDAKLRDDGSIDANRAVTTNHIRDSAVTTAKVSDGAITGAKLAASDGWISISDTWTYATASTFAVSGDKQSLFRIGTRIKLTQTTDKYFVVKNVYYSSSTTTVTVTAGDDYSLANAAITSPKVSYVNAPYGFPSRFAYTPSVSGFSGSPTAICHFSISVDGIVDFWVNVSGTSDANTLSMTLPCRIADGIVSAFPVGGVNNGTNLTTPSNAYLNRLNTATAVRFGIDMSYYPTGVGSAGWTTSGTKGVMGLIRYPGVLGP